MPGACATCRHPQVREINHRLREENRPLTDISLWLDSIGTPITRQALARHTKHMERAPERKPGRPGPSGDFLEVVRDEAFAGVTEGRLPVTLGDGLKAQAQLDARLAKRHDQDLLIKIAIALGGGSFARIVSPEVDVIEGEFRALRQLPAGD